MIAHERKKGEPENRQDESPAHSHTPSDTATGAGVPRKRNPFRQQFFCLEGMCAVRYLGGLHATGWPYCLYWPYWKKATCNWSEVSRFIRLVYWPQCFPMGNCTLSKYCAFSSE